MASKYTRYCLLFIHLIELNYYVRLGHSPFFLVLHCFLWVLSVCWFLWRELVGSRENNWMRKDWTQRGNRVIYSLILTLTNLFKSSGKRWIGQSRNINGARANFLMAMVNTRTDCAYFRFFRYLVTCTNLLHLHLWTEWRFDRPPKSLCHSFGSICAQFLIFDEPLETMQ